MLAAAGYAAQLEREKTLERTSRGKMSRVKQRGALPPGSVPPYGYTWMGDERARLAIDNVWRTRAAVVRRTYAACAAGHSISVRLPRRFRTTAFPTPSQVYAPASGRGRQTVAFEWSREGIRVHHSRPSL